MLLTEDIGEGMRAQSQLGLDLLSPESQTLPFSLYLAPVTFFWDSKYLEELLAEVGGCLYSFLPAAVAATARGSHTRCL